MATNRTQYTSTVAVLRAALKGAVAAGSQTGSKVSKNELKALVAAYNTDPKTMEYNANFESSEGRDAFLLDISRAAKGAAITEVLTDEALAYLRGPLAMQFGFTFGDEHQG